jgi:phenylacetate-CoA ligase
MTQTHVIGYKMTRGLPPQFVQLVPVMVDGRPVRVEEMVRMLEEFRPHVLTCFGTTLRMIAEYKANEPKLPWAPRAIISTGATLDREARALAEQVFPGVRVFDLYGSTDTGYLAWTCQHERMHLNTDCAHIEIVDRDGAPAAVGEGGHIYVTTFWHRTLPIVRYRLGDVVAISGETCACGRSLPLLRQGLGRENTLLYRPTAGRPEPISQGYIVELFETVEGVHRFRLVQSSLEQVDVEVVAKPDARAPEAEIARRLGEVFGPSTRVAVRRVSEILPNPRSGKMMPVERTFKV